MAENKISYLNRTFEDYKESLREYIKTNYPQIASDFNDASIGSWLIDLVASIGDNLSYHIDNAYGETNIETAQCRSSIFSLARSNGVKIPGPKGAMTEMEFSCELPVITDYYNADNQVPVPNEYYAPIIKKGTRLSGSGQYFEVMNNIDFSEQFDDNGVSNREIIPQRNANGVITSYIVKKRDIAVAGQSKIYKQVISSSDIKPFMEIIIPDTDVMNVEGILFKDGVNYQDTPLTSEFSQEVEYISAADSPTKVDTYRFFEVDSLTEQYRWGRDISNTNAGNQVSAIPKVETYGYYNEIADTIVPTSTIVKGEWKPLTQKFITEFTDNGYLKIIFGSGEQAGQTPNIDCAQSFTKHRISKMIRNNFMGKLPKSGWTMYVLYRVGGGASSNVAAGTITNIDYLDAEIGSYGQGDIDQSVVAAVRNSIRVTNTIPSVSGKDAPTVEEIRNMIKYRNLSQNRCITLKDYENRILQMPPQYGCPFRVSATEENNKIMLYLLGIDYLGKLTSVLPSMLITNIQNYLSQYRSINDYVEIKSGRVINLSFEVDLYINKNYNSGDVIRNVIRTIKEYMDINKHFLGEDIYVSDIEKEISKVDGVLNLIDLRVYNEHGDNYSSTVVSQPIKSLTYDNEANIYDNGYSPFTDETQSEIDLEASDYILNSDSDTMFEIKYDSDIKVKAKVR